jgi:hypothetical protein
MRIEIIVCSLFGLVLANVAAAKGECDCRHFPWSPECEPECGATVLNSASPQALTDLLHLDKDTSETIVRKRSKQPISSLDQLKPDLSAAQVTEVSKQIKALNRGQAEELLRIRVDIAQPAQDGVQVGKEMDVEGTAFVPEGNHVWVLAHVVDGFEDFWWPQGQGKIDPATHHWKVHVFVGQPQDIGKNFELAVITVADREHFQLQDWLKKGMATGDFKPMEMPPTTTAPLFRTVRKVR